MPIMRSNYMAGDRIYIPNDETLLALGWEVVPREGSTILKFGSDSVVKAENCGRLMCIMGTDGDQIQIGDHWLRPQDIGEEPRRGDVVEYPGERILEVGNVIQIPPEAELLLLGFFKVSDGSFQLRADSAVIRSGWVGQAVEVIEITEHQGEWHYKLVLVGQASQGPCYWVRQRAIPMVPAKYKDILSDINERILAKVAEQRRLQESKIWALANSTSVIDAANKGLVKVGFELEFQKVNGRDSDCDNSPEYDEEAIDELVDEAVAEVKLPDLIKRLDGSERAFFTALMTDTKVKTNTTKLMAALDTLPTLKDKFQSLLLEAAEDYRSWYRRNCVDLSQFLLHEGGMYGNFQDCGHEALIDCGTDGSVRGGEIRTVGGLTPAKFMKVISDLLRHNKFVIDNGCSFHIHVSASNVSHRYGRFMQAELTAYVLSQYHRWPESLRVRYDSSSVKYFKPNLSPEKYTFVHYNDRSKAWEFRIFGAVNNATDARKCLYMAIEALRHAYRVKLKLNKPLAPSTGVLSLLTGRVKSAAAVIDTSRIFKEIRTLLRNATGSALTVADPGCSCGTCTTTIENEAISDSTAAA